MGFKGFQGVSRSCKELHGSQVEGCQVEGYRRSILGPFFSSLNVAPARLREARLRDKDVQP